MNKKLLLMIIITVLGIALTAGIIFIAVSPFRNNSDTPASSDSPGTVSDGSGNETGDDDTYNPSVNNDTKPATIVPTPTPEPEVPFVPATEMDLDPSSITVFVNKEYALPKSYKPEDMVVPNVYFDLTYYDERTLMRAEAAGALEELFAAAQANGYKLCGVSGYRSYTRQYNIFTNNILTKGKEHTLLYSAVPGTSEHQTGLAMDLSCESLNFDLSTTFSETPEGIWLAQNAYRYGYIIRYPKGKGNITGYAYEPWHIRYVGKGLAKYMYENDLTLEEYYKYKPGKDFDFEALYADLINITPSATPTPTGLPGVTITPTGALNPGEGVTGTPAPTDKPKITPEATPAITNIPISGNPEEGQNGTDNGDSSNTEPGASPVPTEPIYD